MNMKLRYRLFLRRKSVYYAFDDTTKTFTSLKTKDKAQANRLLMAMNEAGQQPAMNLSLARVYLRHSDPLVSTRTWQNVLEEIIAIKSGPTQDRWKSAAKDKAFDLIRHRVLIETQAEHLLAVLRTGSVSTNAFLRKIHNFAVDMNWLPATVIPRRQWPAIHYKEKRAITLEEHQKILAEEVNPERKTLYQLCWHLGASQGDIALLKGEDVDWQNNTISFTRKKTGVPVLVHLGSEALNLFNDLPSEGALFPYLSRVRAGDRATEFASRCRQLGFELQKEIALPLQGIDVQLFAESLVSIAHLIYKFEPATSEESVADRTLKQIFKERNLEPTINALIDGEIEKGIRVNCFLPGPHPLACKVVKRRGPMLSYMEQWGWRWTDVKQKNPSLLRGMVYDPDKQEWDDTTLNIGKSVCDIFCPYFETQKIHDAIDRALRNGN